jgi:hypothetical protein
MSHFIRHDKGEESGAKEIKVVILGEAKEKLSEVANSNLRFTNELIRLVSFFFPLSF